MTAPTLAAERTALAWRRTAVAAMGIAALFMHEAVVTGWRAASVAPVAAGLALLALAAVSYLRNRSLRHGHWGHGATVIAVTTVAVIGVAIAAAVIGSVNPVF